MATSDTFQPGAPVVFSSPTRKGPPKLRWGDVMFEVPPGASLRTLWEARRTGTPYPPRHQMDANDVVIDRRRVLIRVVPPGRGAPRYYVPSLGRVRPDLTR